MKASDIHMLSPRNVKPNVKPGSYTRSLNIRGLVALSRHLAAVRGGGGGVAYR